MAEIALRNVCKQFDSTHYGVKDFTLDIHDKEFVIFVGPSGCGKSTLLSLICGLLPCSDGQITINGRNLKESTTNVGYMLQHDELFEWLSLIHI